MARGVFPRKRHSVDPGLPIIKPETDYRKEQEWYNALTSLIFLVNQNISRYINYQHVNLTLPKTPLPLYYKGIHHDFSYIDPHGNLIFVLINVIPKRRMTRAMWEKLYKEMMKR